jgi:hypothetical protein
MPSASPGASTPAAARQIRDHADGIPSALLNENQVTDLQARRAGDRRAGSP